MTLLSYTHATVFLLAVTLATVLTPWASRLAFRMGAVDLPGPRRLHRQVRPRLGGLALVLAAGVPFGLVLLLDTHTGAAVRGQLAPLAGLAGGLVPVVALGMWDDVRGASARLKFPVQILAATIAYACGCRILEVSHPFSGEPIPLGWLAYPATVLWIVGITNALNLIDGLDGLAAGIGGFASFTTFVVATQNGQVAVALVSLGLSGACLGFLRYNFPPATVFLGDTGSLSLGFILAVLTLLGAQKGSAAVAILVPITVLGIPIFDTVTTLFRRLMRRRPLFQGDADHIHHRVQARSRSTSRSALLLYAVAAVLMAFALLLAWYQERRDVIWVVLATAAFIVVVGGGLGYLDIAGIRTQMVAGRHQHRLTRRRQRAIGRLESRLTERPREEIWAEAEAQLVAWGFENAQVIVLRSAGEDPRLPGSPASAPLPSRAYHSRVVVMEGQPVAILVAGRDAVDPVDRLRDREALESLATLLERVLAGRRSAPDPVEP